MTKVKCKNCRHMSRGFCPVIDFRPDPDKLVRCDFFDTKTNADHIRSMTDEELAEWLVLRTVYSESAWSAPSYLNFKTCTDDDFDGALKGTSEWLKQPFNGGE